MEWVGTPVFELSQTVSGVVELLAEALTGAVTPNPQVSEKSVDRQGLLMW